jgi:Methyltransferase domain
MDNHQTCRCCTGQASKIFTGHLIGHTVAYFDCPSCGYVQTEEPHWLKQAYATAINNSDTGIMMRNQTNTRIVLATLLLMGKINCVVVDFAGGYGILVRLLRDFGVNALWSDRYCQNLLARGFEYRHESAELVTAFEAFEHFVHPDQELDRLLSIAPNVLFSTELMADPAPQQDDWWYYGKEHGQHIGFFRLKTLQKLAKQRGKFLASNGASFHLMTDKPIQEIVWKTIIKFNKVLPFIIQHKLVSKVWTDHQLMVDQ